LVPVVLVSSVAGLLYFPPFQRWAVKQASEYASEKTGMDVSVGNVRLKFPLDLQLGDVKVVKPQEGSPGDTIANIKNIVADVQLKPLLKKQVVIDELSIEDAKVNTDDFIDAARVKGTIGQLRVTNSDVLFKGKDDPKVSDVNLKDILLKDANLDIALPDSVPEDTTESETPWRILAEKAEIENSDVKLTMPGTIDEKTGKKGEDTVVKAHLGKATLAKGSFNLKSGNYDVGSLDIQKGRLSYNDISADDVSMKANNISYSSANGTNLSADLKSLSMKEKGGFNLKNASGKLAMTDNRLKLKNAKIETSESSISTDVDMALDAFDTLDDPAALARQGTMKATVHASLGKQDLMRFMKDMPEGFRQKWPNQQLKVDGVVRGNMNNMAFSDLNASLPTAFRVKGSGTLQNLDHMDRLKADIDFDAHACNVGFVKELLPTDLQKDISIPKNLALKGNVKVDGKQFAARFNGSENGGTVGGTVSYDASREAYTANLQANRLALHHFLPNYGLSPFTGKVELKGQGTDLMSPRTNLTAKADIKQFNYAGYSLAGMKADAKVRNGRAYANIDSQNDLLKGSAYVDALMSKNRFRGTVVMDLSKADLKQLGIVDSMLTVSGCAHLDINSDLKQSHKVEGSLGDLTLRMRNDIYRPDDMWINAETTPAKTMAEVDCGDFHLDLDAKGNYEQLLSTGDKLMTEVQRQYDERLIDEGRLRALLPDATLSLSSGRDNFIVELMSRYGYEAENLNCNVISSPLEGLNGNLHLESLLIDSILLDTINFAIKSDSVRTTYKAQIRNNKDNPQYTFNALLDGILQDRGTIFGARLYDAKGKLGVRLGMQATMEDNGLMFRTYGKEPILGYRTFQVNDSNYIYLGRDNRVSADVSLRADDGTGVQIYTNDDNEEVKQDITASLYHFDLERVLSVVPYTPDISGMLNGDVHFLQTDDQVSFSSALDIHQMAYEKTPMGDIGTEFVYMPKTDGSHYVDGILKHNGEEIAVVSGTYYNKGGSELSEDEGYLDAQVDMARTPLSLLNGFIPDQIIGFEGYGEGSVAVKGPLMKPDVDGEIYLDSAYMVSLPYGVRLRFDNDPVIIKDSHILFENFNLYANNSSPLLTYGSLDFADLNHMRLDMKMRAQNFLLIDSKENPRSEAYGKAYVNFFGNIGGELTNLKLRGKLDVLGSTDLVYILRDSPLTTDNQLDDLVRFTNFSDTTKTIVTRPELYGFSMDMTVDVSKGAHLMAYLNADKSNYMDLMGGGTLRLSYDMVDDLRLTGRYTLSNGEMKYSLPIIPLKTFTIQDGSYIEFTGDPMNPTLNIQASERVKTSVSGNSGVGRSVLFDCGVNITKTLNDMGLEFTLDAPQDMQLHSELQSMSKEQRGKLAVTMLTTGMYLADGNTNGFSMNNALNTFLQSEINNITGNALRTLDFSVGLDNTTDATGNTSTNYSFKFAKRFWNNRLKISVGGKVSTGPEIQNQNQSFFDNVTFEYRLDDTANKYVTLFYENNVYDWLDGYTQEYGVGFIWRRSLQNFMDIFNLRDKTTPTDAWPIERKVQQNDTTRAVIVNEDSTKMVIETNHNEQQEQ